MRAPYAGLLAGVCVGVTAAAEIGAVVFGWGLQPAYTSVLFGSVADNGVGGAAARVGSGLAGLADRVDAAGGRLLVRSDAAGTLVTAELPCA